MSQKDNVLNKELVTALKKLRPSPHCKGCKAYAGLLDRVCALYEEAVSKGERKVLTRQFVDKILPYLVSLAAQVVKHMTMTN